MGLGPTPPTNHNRLNRQRLRLNIVYTKHLAAGNRQQVFFISRTGVNAMNQPQKRQVVTYEQQIEMGLIRPRAANFVPAAPAPRLIPSAIVDPYAQHHGTPVQFVVHHEVTPETRAKAMVMKTHQVTIFLAVLTGALMWVFQLHPLNAGTLVIFLLWLALASFEWLAAFALLAVLDWRETPSALEWKRTDGYLSLMKREQSARLMTLYGLSEEQVKRLDR